MNQIVIAFLSVLLILPQSASAKETNIIPFWWDTLDTEITTVSIGTGGSRQNTPVERYPKCFDNWDDQEQEFIFAIDDMLEEWETREGPEWEAKSHTTTIVDNKLIHYVLWSEEATDYYDNSIPLAWRVWAVTFDLDSREKINLSDLFYDDVNYIRYINEQAMLALQKDVWKITEYIPVVEEMQRRPFSGFPRDYPYFHIVEGELGGRVLELLVPYENPLFTTGLTSQYTAIQIPLPDTISPYGAPWANVTIDTSDSQLHIASISLPEGKDPLIAEKINDGLLKIAQQALEHPMIQAGVEYFAPLMPHVSLREKYLSVRYFGSESYRERDQAMIAAATFDIETGDAIDGLELWREGTKLIEEKGIPDGGDLWSHPFCLLEEWVADDFYYTSSDDSYEMPPLSEMAYIGCAVCYAPGGEWMAHMLYFDPKMKVEHRLQISVELLREKGLLQ